MAFNGRIQKLEASLAAKQKFLLWLEHAKAAGGFTSYWEGELKGPLVPFEWFADGEAYFLWHLINDVNFTILKNAQANHDLRTFAHCALDGVLRQIAQPDPSGVFVAARPISGPAVRVGASLYAKFKTLLEEALLLQAAIEEISETYLGGEDILFADSRAVLDDEISNLSKTARLFAPLATWLNVEPIAVEGFSPDRSVVDAKAANLASFSRANALTCRGTVREFISALHEFCPVLLRS